MKTTKLTSPSNNKSIFKQSKLIIAMSLFTGAMGATMLTSAPSFADTATNNTSAQIAGTLPNLTKMIKTNRSAVVGINAKFSKSKTKSSGSSRDSFRGLPPQFEELFKNMPQQPRGYDFGARKKEANGSGFIISSDGYVVTNAHVIEDSDKVTVALEDKRELKAKVIGVDKLSDIALLKVEATDLPMVELGNSDKLDVGQWVVAMGTPFGLDYTATQGIVSALSRSLPNDSYVPFIQTDAAVNPGNSGGPLFDLDGQVVGVNSQIYSRSGGYMGVSFAIPSNLVKNVTEQLKANGSVSRGWLGVGIQGIDEDLSKSLNLSNSKGSLITSVQSDSPADKAGLQAGDVITQFNNKTVDEVSDLPVIVASTKIGSKVPVSIVRVGKNKTLAVTVEKLKGKNEEPVLASLQKGSLGVAVSSLSSEEKTGLANKNEGVKIEKVLEDSVAATAGLRTGDIILKVGGKSIASPAKLKSEIAKADVNKPLAILLKRGDQAIFVAVQLNS